MSSWSRSGRLLASGSDDTYLNIYSYQPDSSTAPFALGTTIATGHSANIFSVKFMPHSNDQTLVTCAGDWEVRVFDVEYSSRNNAAGVPAAELSSSRSKRITNFFTGAQYLNERNTNARVYRSHADRVKRIVTESSPFLFLTCSEDGEVRQWDLRQPSSAYPPPNGGQGFMAYRSRASHYDSNIPPPLISYKRYHLDLNTISCSATQPHYIALGGAHLHCFLHDRRMAGRDMLSERGQMGSVSPVAGTTEDESMAYATRCVRRFAPKGKKRMDSRSHGHITACKISDANPNEMVVSWSGDHIYSFDIIRSPDARDSAELKSTTSRRASPSPTSKKAKTRKRKHEKISPEASPNINGNNQSSPPVTSPSAEYDDPDTSLRVRFGNGESGNISIPPANQDLDQYSMLNEAQKLAMRIARVVLKIRKLMFSLNSPIREMSESDGGYDSTLFAPNFSEALGYAAAFLPQLDDVIRTWRYPMDPSQHQVILHQTLRRNRESTRRFVQATGTLARFLGGTIRTPSSAESPRSGVFRRILPAPTEDGVIDAESQFTYDFLKAILLWLDGGRESLLIGFKLGQANRRNKHRYPVPDDAGDEAIESALVPYLQSLSSSAASIVNVDASRFEYDDTRVIFTTQLAAVDAFAEAVRESRDDDRREGSDAQIDYGTQQRAKLIQFWGLKVARGLLMSAGEDLGFHSVNRAFGGLRMMIEPNEEDDRGWERVQEDIDVEEGVNVFELDVSRIIAASRNTLAHRNPHMSSTDVDRIDIGGQFVADEEHEEGDSGGNWGGGKDDEEGDEEDEDDEDDEVEDSDDSRQVDDEDDEDEMEGYFLRHEGFRDDGSRNVEIDVPCSSHVNVYRGHCNYKTVKDVNYFGLDDEYVVSGSDSGHVFIWDRKTSNLVNILHGDGEVVNVVQGEVDYHTYMELNGNMC